MALTLSGRAPGILSRRGLITGTAAMAAATALPAGPAQAGPLINPYAFKPAAGVPYSAVVMSLRGEGADGSNSFTNHSSYGRTLTANGNVQNDTGVNLHGTSILFDGSGDMITMADAPELSVGASDLCFECYARTTNLGHLNTIIEKRGSEEYAFSLNTNGSVIFIAWLSGSTTAWNVQSPAGSVAANTEFHLAAIKLGSTAYVCVNGVVVQQGAVTGAVNETSDTLMIGGSNTSSRFFEGNLNHVRMTIGYARYTSFPFTPDSTPFPTS